MCLSCPAALSCSLAATYSLRGFCQSPFTTPPPHLHDQVCAPSVREAEAGGRDLEVLVATSKVQAGGRGNSSHGGIRHNTPAQ